jgi:hypothetical protein
VFGRRFIIATLVVAFGLGTYSFIAIKRTASRRTSLVDQIAAEMPEIPGARILSPWEPATYADDVRAMYCLDAESPASGASRAVTALSASGWHMTEMKHDLKTDTAVFTMAGPVYLRGGVARGTRPDCDGAKGQVTLAFDGTRDAPRAK